MNSHTLPLDSFAPPSVNTNPSPQTAPVSGFARSFLTYNTIPNAKITILENGVQFNTDSDGRFGPFQYTVGKPITLVLEKQGFHTTQSATITVPPEGLNDPLHEISFQVPSDFAFNLFRYALGVTLDENACQVTAAITAHHKTMADIPQGEADAKAVLTPDANVKPFYFGIFKRGPLKDKTNPLQHHLTASSLDGGVGYLNLPPRDEPYTLTAVKAGVTFNEVKFIARKGMFINISPPQGPMAQEEPNHPQIQEQPQIENSKNNINPPTVKNGWGHFGLFALALTGTALAVGTEVYRKMHSPK